MLRKDVQGFIHSMGSTCPSYYYIACGGFGLLHYYNSLRPLMGIIEEVHSFGH